MRLYTDQGNFQTLKILISSKLCGINFEIVDVDVKSSGADGVVPFLSRTKLPVLEVYDGKFLFSVNTATKYLFLKAGKAIDEDAENEILDWENSELLPIVAAYLVSAVGHSKKDTELATQVAKTANHIENKLSKVKFFLGNSLSICDICVFATIFPLLDLKNSDVLDKLPNIKRWCTEVRSIQAVQAAVLEVTGGKGHEIYKASLLAQSFPRMPSSTSVQESNKSTIPSSNSKASGEEALEVKVSQEELDVALQAWRTDPKDCPQPRARIHPILPEPSSRNLLICSALPYVNNVPHLGNIIGCVLSADVFSRYARLRNYNSLYVCGTDEYGTATETKASEEGVTPKEICDKYNKIHSEVYKWFNIDFDSFGRTSAPEQTEIAQDLFWKLYKHGYILEDSMDQLKCTACDKFLADRFVEGTCPMCQYEDARGDQCDSCGKLINAVELINPKCKACKSSPVIRNSNHIFLDLPKLQPLLSEHLNQAQNTGTWTNNAKVITNSWLRDGLKPRCISRDLKWGIPVPLQGYEDKVFYVWFDAPIGYISMTKTYTSEWRQWWKKNNHKVELYHFLGKDNVPFHSVIFPSCLLGAKDDYTVVDSVVATEYLNYEDTKFSKSRGTGIFGDQAAKTGIPADIFRFYLLYLRPESQDTAFSWDDMQLKNNSELLNNLGNFINRALMFLHNNFGGIICDMDVHEEDVHLFAQVSRELKLYISNLEECRMRDGLRNILTMSRLGNQYMQGEKPWVLIKGSPADKQRAGCVVSVCANLACLLSVLLQPYMPATSAVIQEQLQAPPSVNIITDRFVPMLRAGHMIGTPSPLFQKMETSTIAELKAKFMGNPTSKPAAKPCQKVPGATAMSLSSSASPEEVERLTKAVADQGMKVRELKAAKAEKSKIDAEVATLLQLKKELSQAAPGDNAPSAGTAGKKKGKGGGGGDKSAKPSGGGGGTKPQANETKPAVDKVNGAVDSVQAERLTREVEDQGNKVRELKAAKAEKSVINEEVATLLRLKQDLAMAQGLDPDTPKGGGAKKKGKK